ncbi:MAG: DUF86 domain-containing protein [Candidatus Omnitrophica bacterium]|nr:DUF86 domain-containing protein [Candidatus Omnitrophota bacterium]
MKQEIRDYLKDIVEAMDNAISFVYGMEKYPQIPWSQMAGMRDKLIHEYFGIVFVPKVKPLIEEILKGLNKNE